MLDLLRIVVVFVFCLAAPVTAAQAQTAMASTPVEAAQKVELILSEIQRMHVDTFKISKRLHDVRMLLGGILVVNVLIAILLWRGNGRRPGETHTAGDNPAANGAVERRPKPALSPRTAEILRYQVGLLIGLVVVIFLYVNFF